MKDADSKRRLWTWSRSRSRSPRRNNSNVGSEKIDSSHRGVQTWVWCNKPGHGYKTCYKFQEDVSTWRARYDVKKRKFVRVYSVASRDGGGSGASRGSGGMRDAASPRRSRERR